MSIVNCITVACNYCLINIDYMVVYSYWYTLNSMSFITFLVVKQMALKSTTYGILRLVEATSLRFFYYISMYFFAGSYLTYSMKSILNTIRNYKKPQSSKKIIMIFLLQTFLIKTANFNINL